MNKLTKIKNKVIATVISSMAVANMMAMTAYAEGDVSGAIQSTWNDAKSQIKSIVNNVVFPVLDVVLVILLFVKIGTLYMEYRKHGQFEWTPIAIIFGCLLFTLTAPLYIWSVVEQGQWKIICESCRKSCTKFYICYFLTKNYGFCIIKSYIGVPIQNTHWRR